MPTGQTYATPFKTPQENSVATVTANTIHLLTVLRLRVRVSTSAGSTEQVCQHKLWNEADVGIIIRTMAKYFLLWLLVVTLLPSRTTEQLMCYQCTSGDDLNCGEVAEDMYLYKCPFSTDCCALDPVSTGYKRWCSPKPCTTSSCCCENGCNKDLPQPPTFAPPTGAPLNSEARATATLICVLGGSFLALLVKFGV